MAKDDPDDQRDDQSLGDLGGYIRAQRKQAQLSLRKLASLAGVSNPYLSQIERGLRNPSAEILQAIARGLEISSETLYVQAGILDPDHAERTDVETAIVRARELTEGQRTSLLEMYRSFRRLAALERGEDPDAPPAAAAGDGEPAVDVAPPVGDAEAGEGAEASVVRDGGDDPERPATTARNDDA